MKQGTVPDPTGRALNWQWVAVRLLLVIPILQLYATLRWGLKPPGESDYQLLYVHAEMARSGQPLYWPWPEYGPHFGTTGLRFPSERIFYPPFLTPILSTITRWGVVVFSRIWVVILWGCYWVYAGCLAKLATGRVNLLPVVSWGIGIFLVTGRAAQSALNLGNVDPLLWAMFGLALAYPAARGAGFIGIALVKLYGAWPLLAAAVLRDWRTLRGAGVTLGVMVALTSIILGPGRWLAESVAWLRYMLPVAGQGTFNPYNVSISFFGLRVARWLGWTYVAGPLPDAARLYLTLVGIAAPLGALWIFRRAEIRMRYALVVCAAVFFAPLAWNFYTPLLLAPVALYFRPRSFLSTRLAPEPVGPMGTKHLEDERGSAAKSGLATP